MLDGVKSIDFSWELWKNAIKADENGVLSPISILSAFSMLLSGAKSHTATNLKKALQIDPHVGDDKYHQAFTGYIQSLNKLAKGKEDEVRVSLANRLFLQNDYKLESNFVDVLRKCYLADVGVVNFSDSQAAVATINKWVEQQTNHKIKNLIGSLASDTRLVLVNAIHFKGTWESEFNHPSTIPKPFHVLRGPAKKVPMMNKEDEMRILDESSGKLQSQAVELRFTGGRFRLVVLVPKPGHALHTLEASLSASEIQRVMHDMQQKRVNLSLPKFRVESQLDLNEALSKLGASDVFSKSADLSGMCTHEKLCVSKAIHKAFLSVDELGAEAAAASAELCVPCCMKITPPPDVYVTVDRPFVTWIWDQETSTALFMARVTEP